MLQFVHLAAADSRRSGACRSGARISPRSTATSIQPRRGAQASRCSQCGVPFCSVHCPLNNNIPDWLKLDRRGPAARRPTRSARATNNFPEICGRICPQDRLCEGNCVIEKGFESVTIGAVERFITDTALDAGLGEAAPAAARAARRSVGIVGAGPGGLAAAEQLRRRGYQVHVYDRYDRVGGLLIYGIPGFKLEKEIVAAPLRAAGAGAASSSTSASRSAATSPFAELRARHDAVLIATGVYKARDIAAPGVGLPGIVPALDYLTASQPQGPRRRRARVRQRHARMPRASASW